MVNAQEYIEKNFGKDVKEINAKEKNLVGDLDLSEYTKLTGNIDLGYNRSLRSLKLAPKCQASGLNIYDTGIEKFDFLINLPKINWFCFPHPKNADGDNTELATAIRDISIAKCEESQK